MMSSVYLSPDNIQLINMYFKISKFDAMDLMEPIDALNNFAATDDKVIAAYKLGLSIGFNKGRMGGYCNYTEGVSGN